MREVFLRVQVPPGLHVTGDQLGRLQCGDQTEGLVPCLQQRWGFDFFDPVAVSFAEKKENRKETNVERGRREDECTKHGCSVRRRRRQ